MTEMLVFQYLVLDVMVYYMMSLCLLLMTEMCVFQCLAPDVMIYYMMSRCLSLMMEMCVFQCLAPDVLMYYMNVNNKEATINAAQTIDDISALIVYLMFHGKRK